MILDNIPFLESQEVGKSLLKEGFAEEEGLQKWAPSDSLRSQKFEQTHSGALQAPSGILWAPFDSLHVPYRPVTVPYKHITVPRGHVMSHYA